MTVDLVVEEEFVGLYNTADTSANTLVSILHDCLLRLNLSVNKLRGQCYDGASSMAGKRNGVAKQITNLEERAVYTHCYGHFLNLACCDTIKRIKLLKDAMDITHEITKLIKQSPRRDSLFRAMKEQL